MDVYQAMSNLRAVRRLRPDPIADDVLERVLEAGCWAPTGGNQQPWRVIVVKDPARKQALQDVYEPEWNNYRDRFLANLAHLPDDELDRWRRVASAGDHLASHLHEAPVVLMFCANPKAMALTDAKLDRPSIIGGASIYTVVQNVMLACVAEGLGCTLTTLHCLREPEVKSALSIPESWWTAAMVPIGHPVGRGHGPISRRPPAEMAALDTFDGGWPGS